MNNILLIALGGAIGSVCRYGCQKWMYQLYPHQFPLGTFTVNILGSFLVGLFFALSEKSSAPTGWTSLLIIGFCGGFTTFSAFSLETLSLLRNKEMLTALLYILVSVLLGLMAVWAGYTITRLKG
jgi:CrcB protein